MREEGDERTHLWWRLARSPRRLLALDYDGTLAPFRVARDRATPLPGVAGALRELRDRGRTTLAVISGRESREVANLLGVGGIQVWGNHGYEHLDADGTLHREPLSERQRAGLAAAEAVLDPRLDPTRVEHKQCGIALHTRGVAPGAAARMQEQVEAAWSALAGAHELSCRRFNGGVELRAASGIDKGSALDRIMQGLPGRLAVYIGDDDTDEDAFALLARGGGVGLKVGLSGQTAASGRLADCAAVLALLRRWNEEEERA